MWRYSEHSNASSKLDPIQDTLIFLEYLSAKDYVRDLLQRKWALSKEVANKRADRIRPHIDQGIEFIRLSMKCDNELAFLPSYYGILNLTKAAVLFGPVAHLLEAQRWHGVTYDVNLKDSRSLPTEQVEIKTGGALPLYYRSVIGKPIPTGFVKLDCILSYVRNVGAEYKIAFAKHNSISHFKITFEEVSNPKRARICATRIDEDTKPCSIREFKVLKHFTQDASDKNKFWSRKTLLRKTSLTDPSYRDFFVPELVYDFNNFGGPSNVSWGLLTARCSARRAMIEELPLFLLFFYMSSIVRYKPEFVEKLSQTRYRPILSAAKSHCLLRYLTLIWSFCHKQNLILSHGD